MQKRRQTQSFNSTADAGYRVAVRGGAVRKCARRVACGHKQKSRGIYREGRAGYKRPVVDVV
jgi:hypothetical protein